MSIDIRLLSGECCSLKDIFPDRDWWSVIAAVCIGLWVLLLFTDHRTRGICTHFPDNRHFSDRTIGTVL